MKIVGIIPARYASSRFPGKPLVDIHGKTMIQRVYEQALACNSLSEVFVATDDERIANAVQHFGGQYCMTSPEHQSGTDRCAEVVRQQGTAIDVIINIQGDEPFISPRQIQTLVDCFQEEHTQIATLIKPIQDAEELFNPNSPKVVINNQKEALYFSRNPIPYGRNWAQDEWKAHHVYYKHIGLYGYRTHILTALTNLPPSPLEKAESLEQLRWLENGYRIQTAITDLETLAIDTPDDLAKALHIYKP